MPASDQRLTTAEMARFAAEGYLRFDALVPDEINRRAIVEFEALERVKVAQALGRPVEDGDEVAARLPRPASRTPLSKCFPAPSAIGDYLRLPAVQGIIRSLVGDDPLYDHDFVHRVAARNRHGQHLHVDAIADSTDPAFDVQLFWFPRAVEAGGGGTRFVPGTHLRAARAEAIGRYQHLLGEQHFAGPAGTVIVFHQGVWHAGQPNPSDAERWMYKIRLNPAVPQVRLWNCDDFAEVHNDSSDHIYATVRPGSAASALRKMQAWQKGHEARYDLVQRARLWRYLSGDEHYDVDYYLTRAEGRTALLGTRP